MALIFRSSIYMKKIHSKTHHCQKSSVLLRLMANQKKKKKLAFHPSHIIFTEIFLSFDMRVYMIKLSLKIVSIGNEH